MEIAEKLRAQQLEKGLEYKQFDINVNESISASAHVLLVDPLLYKIFPVKSRSTKRVPESNLFKLINSNHRLEIRPDENLKQQLPLQKTSTILAEKSCYRYGVNGSFFMYYEDLKNEYFTSKNKQPFYGDPVGWYRLNGKDYSFPHLNRNAVMFKDDGSVSLKRVSLLDGKLKNVRTRNIFKLYAVDTDDILDKTIYFIKGKYAITNKSKYRAAFSGNVITFISKPSDGPKKIRIPNNGFVVSFSTNDNIKNLKVGDQFEFILKRNNKHIRHAVSVGPTLLRNGLLQTNDVWEKEDFKHFSPKTLTNDLYKYSCARTVLFTLKGSNYIGFIVTEGLPLVGLTLDQLARVAKELVPTLKDCVYLDGGGCSTICRRNGKVIETLNLPSGVSNQNVSDTKPGKESYVGYSIIISTK